MRPIYKKSRPIKNPKLYTQWNKEHTHCQCCGVSSSMAVWPGLTTHHIIKSGRSDEPTNLLRLCPLCHDAAEGLSHKRDGVILPGLPVAICLRIKREREPGCYDAVRLAELRGSNLPQEEDIPDIYRALWCSNQHGSSCHCE